VRSFLVAAVAVSASISGAAAQQQPCAPGNAAANFFSNIGAATSPATAAQRDFERAACEYRNCIAVNSNNINACEGLRHIMDASAAAAGQYNGSSR
jgi:hypothetical protein